MIRSIENISRGNRVSSEETRDITDSMYQKYASGYHKILQLYGLLNTTTLGLEMTSSAMSSVLSSLVVAEDNIVTFDPYSTHVYPSSLTEGEKAEYHQEFMAFIAKRVNSQLVFTDTYDRIDSSLSLVKTVYTSDNSIPTKIVENAIENCLTGAAPFIARYMMESAVRTTLNIDIRSTSKPLSINAIRFVPIPSIGMISLDSIKYGSGSNVVLNGGADLPEISAYTLNRTYQGYIHFRPITTTDLYLALSSETYISSFGAVAVGLSRLIGELNTYASISYIGWEVEYPDGYDKITNLKILPAKYSNGVNGTSVRIYDNLADFNLVNDNYIERCDADTNLNIQYSSVPTPYILLEIENDNGTSPCVGSVKLEFE